MKRALHTMKAMLSAAYGYCLSFIMIVACMAAANDSHNPQIEQQLLQGRKLFLKNCAVCHGIYAEGDPDWRRPDAQGKYPPPPLNGTGHAWHHPHAVLMDIIINGTAKSGGKMPAWKDKLSESQVEYIILWFQSLWPGQIHDAWQRMEREYREKHR